MSFQNKPGSGALFKNDRKTNERQPDWRGPFYEQIGDDIVEREIAAWERVSAKGVRFLSLNVSDRLVPRKSPVEQSQSGTSHKDYSRDFDDDIPL